MAYHSMTARYKLAPGSQVREEDFGLLFYTQRGPGLFFVSSGNLLDEDFFLGNLTLEEKLRQLSLPGSLADARLSELEKTLDMLKNKGVILEC
ncbi:MAG: mycofactocin biosynthesis chaperone MftB [Syntrophobacter sp.]